MINIKRCYKRGGPRRPRRFGVSEGELADGARHLQKLYGLNEVWTITYYARGRRGANKKRGRFLRRASKRGVSLGPKAF